MSESFKLPEYPLGMEPEIDPNDYSNLLEVFHEFTSKWKNKPAYTCMGQTITYAELNEKSAAFAAWLQNNSGLNPGDRVAVQLPNILQYPVVIWGCMRAGMVVVNTNPLYTDRELEHQFNDSGAKLHVVYAGMAAQALRVKPKTSVNQVIVTEIADFHPGLKKLLVNSVVKYIKKMVPAYDSSQVLKLNSVIDKGQGETFYEPKSTHDDVAVLQYTGGTTGVAKGAMLTHRNLIANMLQCKQFFKIKLGEGCETFIAPLPMYHIYAFMVHGLTLAETGNHTVLIPNPRDIPGFVKELQNWQMTGFAGLNTLFIALINHPDISKVDFSKLKLTVSGGMALTHAAAEDWEKLTGCPINEGYGLTETSPVVAFNPPSQHQIGTIGIPAPSTELKVIDDDGNALPMGEPGELCIRGPQVMKGYWNRPEDTAKCISDGFLRTGDVGVIQEDGYSKIVDRKKDMIIVSGFNVYPNEIEDVITSHPDVIEAAAVGVADDKTGEAVKVYIVVKNPIEDKVLVDYCREHLTNYKVPKIFERKDELPKTNVGKVLRRELRD